MRVFSGGFSFPFSSKIQFSPEFVFIWLVGILRGPLVHVNMVETPFSSCMKFLGPPFLIKKLPFPPLPQNYH